MVLTKGGHEVDIAFGLYFFSYKAKEWAGVRLDVLGETSSLWNIFDFKMLVELPWSMRTLDTMKLVITMETTI